MRDAETTIGNLADKQTVAFISRMRRGFPLSRPCWRAFGAVFSR